MNHPKISHVKPLADKRLLVIFHNKVQKIYDCTPLFTLERFGLLQTDAFFPTVQVDAGGYGISWNDEIDLSEYELWENGVEIERVADKSEFAVEAAPQ